MTEITHRLRLERDALATIDVEDGLRRVRRIARRRRRRNSMVGVAAAGGLLVAGVGAAGLIGSERQQVVVTDTAPNVTTDAEPPATPETTDVTTTAAPAPQPTTIGRSVGEAVIGSSVDADLVNVTTELAVGAGDFSLDWQVPWNDGFLISGHISGTDSWAAFSSPDGRTWEPVELEPGFDGVAQDGVTATEGRLVMLSTRQDGTSWTPVVASTTDLSTWTVEDIPIETPPANLPATVDAFTWPRMISANDDGWIAIVENSLMLNSREMAEQRTGRAVTSLSEAWSDEGVLITVDPDTEGVESEDIWITWGELEQELGVELTDALRARTLAEVWTGTWTGEAPVKVEDPVANELLSSYAPIVAVDNGFVALRTTREFLDDGLPIDSTVLFANIDGVGWSELEAPIPEQIAYGFPLDGDLGVVAEADDATISIYRVDVDTGTWTPIEVPGLPQTTSFVETSGTAALALNAAPADDFENRSSTQTFEQNGLRLVWTYDSFISSYEVTSIETGDVVVAESIDIRDVEGSFDLAFDHLTGGLALDITITDPETDDVMMNITAEEMEAANPQEPYYGPDPEPWIVATDDGITWFVYEVPPSDPDRDSYNEEAMTVSGGRLLYLNDDGEWFVVDLT